MRAQTKLWSVVAAVTALQLMACGKPPSPDNQVQPGQTDFVTAEPDNNFRGTTAAGEASSGAPPSANSDSKASAPSGRSGTVEEADTYRVDQNRLFYLNTYRGFIIYDLNDPKNPKRLGRLPIHGYPIEMFVSGNTVYALLRDALYLTQGTDGLKITRRNVSQLVSIDVSDLNAPKVLQEIDIVGQLSEGVSRKIDNTIYVVSNMPQSYYWPGYPYGDNTKEQAWVYSFNVADPKNLQLVEKLQIFEGGGASTSTGTSSSSRWFSGLAISATANTLHVVENWYTYSYTSGGTGGGGDSCGSYSSKEEAVVSIIDISNPDGHIRKHARFTTPGALTDQFKHTYLYDENTQKGYYLGIFGIRGWEGSNCQGSSFIQNTFEAWDVTDGEHPTKVSALEFGHPNETVRGTTFDANRKVAYAVTAQNIDPLYAFDFSDPTHLKVLSSIEGLSGDMTVFRLISNNQFLIGIGRDNSSGCATSGAGGSSWPTNIAVSLIDVRDLKAIRLVQRKCVNVENAEWVFSEVTWNLDQAHKMIGMFSDAETNLVTVPVNYYSKQNTDDGWYWYRPQSAVGMMSYDLNAYDSSKPATQQNVIRSGATVLHPAGAVTRSILFAHEAGGAKRRMMVNLSDTHISVVDVNDINAPVNQAVVEVAPYHARVYHFGDYLVDEVQVGGGSWWQPGASEFRVKSAAPGVDDAATLASFTVGRVDRVVQVKNLLLVFRPVGDPTNASWRSASSQTEVVAYDLSDPTHPTRRGSVTTDFTSYPWYGFWCGEGWGWWPYWGWGSSASSLVTTSQGVAILSTRYENNGYTQRLGFINTTDADHLTISQKDLMTYTYSYNGPYVPPSRSYMGLLSDGDSSSAYYLTWRDTLGVQTATGSNFTRYRYMAQHYPSTLDGDWSVNTPGSAVKVIENGGETRLLSTDSSYRAVTTNGYTNYYPDPRLHLLTRSANTARLRDTVTFSGQYIGDLVGDANRLFVNVRPAYWWAYAATPDGIGTGTGTTSTSSTTTVYEDTLKAIDLSADKLDVRSSNAVGTYGSQLMGLVGNRLFVNLPNDGVMVVDVSSLDSPTRCTSCARSAGRPTWPSARLGPSSLRARSASSKCRSTLRPASPGSNASPAALHHFAPRVCTTSARSVVGLHSWCAQRGLTADSTEAGFLNSARVLANSEARARRRPPAHRERYGAGLQPGRARSRFHRRERLDGFGDVALLGHRRHFERVGEADARHELAGEHLGRGEQLVEQLLGGATGQVFSEVGDFGVFVDEQHPPGFLDARLERRPVVGEQGAQVDDFGVDPVGGERVGGFAAQGQGAAVADDGHGAAGPNDLGDAERYARVAQLGPLGTPGRAVTQRRVDELRKRPVVGRLARYRLVALHPHERLGYEKHDRVLLFARRQHEPVRVERVRRHDHFPPRYVGGGRVERMRMVHAAANAGADGGHDHHGQVPVTVRRPRRVAGQLEQVDGVVDVVAELNFGDGALPRHGEAHGHADDAALVERRVPRGFETLRAGEHASQGGAGVFTENVGHPEVLFGVVQRHANGLSHVGHNVSLLGSAVSQRVGRGRVHRNRRGPTGWRLRAWARLWLAGPSRP